MANTATPRDGTYTGFFYDAVTPALKYYNRGTLVFTVATAAVTTAGALTTDDTATFASAVTTGDHEFSNTITLTGTGVGSAAEEMTSGGAGAVCDWN